MVEEKYISMVEASKLIGVSPATMRKLANERKISHFRIGTRFKFTREDINKFIEARKITMEA